MNRDQEESIETAGRVLCERIQDEVTEFPVLANTVSNSCNLSLLAVCEKISNRVVHDAIKFLITANPHALIYSTHRVYFSSHSIDSIANDDCHCILLPWIAKHYPWVFDHHQIRKLPPHAELVIKQTRGVIEASVVRRFYEIYPQGLKQKNRGCRGFPLQIMCNFQYTGYDADLFEFMAKQYPEAMSGRDRVGTTVLHKVCMDLAKTFDEQDKIFPKENTAQICRFLVNECPQLVRSEGKSGRGLPIHFLAHRLNRPLVQEIAILLLKEYPDAIEIRTRSIFPQLSSRPFVQQIVPLLQQEKDMQQERAWLALASTNFHCFANSNGAEVCVQVGDAFTNWAETKFRKAELEIQQKISELCVSFEGDDVDESVDQYSDDSDDDGKGFGDYVLEDEDSDEYEDFGISSESNEHDSAAELDF